MRHRLSFFFIVLFFLLVPGTGFSDGFPLVDKKDIQLTLNLRIGLLSDYDFTYEEQETTISSAEMSLEGKLYDSLTFKLAIKSEDAESDYALVLDDIYIQYRIHDYINLRIGRFKIPFGEETFYGAAERPYIEKTRTSDKIPPGRDIGLMSSGKNILGLFKYNLGIFPGAEPDLPEDAKSRYLAAGKLSALYKGIPPFSFQLGYNAYYHHYFLDVAQHQLAQGFFSTMSITFGKKNRLFLLAEYQERLRTRNVINQNMDWRRGFFIVTAYRYKPAEPFIVLEWYDNSLLFDDHEDMFLLKTGVTGYCLKKDLLRIKLVYELEYPYTTDIISHKLSMLLQMEI